MVPRRKLTPFMSQRVGLDRPTLVVGHGVSYGGIDSDIGGETVFSFSRHGDLGEVSRQGGRSVVEPELLNPLSGGNRAEVAGRRRGR